MGVRGPGRTICAAGVGFATLMVAAAPAPAATQIGETLGDITLFCGPETLLQTGSPGSTYTTPFAGVITSWSYYSDTMPPPIKFKVARAAGGDNYTIVGDSALVTPAPDRLNTFPFRLPVHAADVIGLYFGASGGCGQYPVPGYSDHSISAADPPPGSTMPYGVTSNRKLDVAATLETDADGDGFGDETQDNCPGVSNPIQADSDGDGIGDVCDDLDPPETTITKRPKKKTHRKKAKFKFVSDEPGSTFECSFDGRPFAPCGSPLSARAGKGKHRFDVRATDPAGNTDPTPAERSWKVRKPKH